MDLKNISCGKSSHFSKFSNIRGNDIAFTEKKERKKMPILKISVTREIAYFTDFQQNDSIFTQKIAHLKKKQLLEKIIIQR